MPIDASDFANRYALLNHDEQEVLSDLLEGLERGREVYGPLNIDSDRRDFANEALEEHRDAIVYLTIEAIQRRRGRRRG